MDLHLARGRGRRAPSARPSTTCSARRRRLGGRRRAAPACDGRARASAATPRGPSATCCCRRCSSVQEHVGWISPGALNYVCLRLDVPPADAYGVATFYALLAVEPRPPRVAARLRGPRLPLPRLEELIAQLEERVGAGGRATRRRRDVVPQPVPRPVRPRAGGDADGRRRAAAWSGVLAPVDARRRAPARCWTTPTSSRRRTRRCRRPATPSLRLLRRVGRVGRRASTTTARRAATPRCGAPSSSGPRA